MENDENKMIALAEQIAEREHKGQTRIGSGIPFVSHPKAVAEEVKRAGGNAVEIAAALLHDTIEDTAYSTLYKDFPVEVADMVMLLTHKEGGNNPEAIMKLRQNKSALRVKMADRLHNITDKSKFGMKYRHKAKVWDSTTLLLEYAKEAGLEENLTYVALAIELEWIKAEKEVGLDKKEK